VLLSRTTRELVEDELPTGVTLRDLGERRLKDLERPERLSQLVIEGLRSNFAPLKTLDVDLARKRRRMYAGAALIGVLAAAVAIPVFALGQGSSGGSANVAPNSVAVIDAASNRVVRSVENVGITPSAIAVGAGSVWVANLGAKTVSRLDPATRSLQATIPLDATATGIAVGAGSVWTGNGILGTVTRIDPSVSSVSATIEDVAPRSSAGTIAIGEGAVWFVSGIGILAKIDPAGARVVGEVIVGVSPSAIAVGEGSVWVVNAGDNTVSRVNPRTTGVVRIISVGRRPQGIAVGGGAVWVSDQADDVVTRIDVASSSVSTISVGKGPSGIAFGDNAIWVANGGDGTVSRIDAETREVRTIKLGNRPSGIAIGNGAVWVTVQAQPST
jgi:YVTN family beta-propeller protein